MADYIDRVHLIKSFCAHCIESGLDGKQCEEDCTDIVIIKNQRIADVRENVHGEWVETVSGAVKCSICGKLDIFEWNFCPNCGADMREVQDAK